MDSDSQGEQPSDGARAIIELAQEARRVLERQPGLLGVVRHALEFRPHRLRTCACGKLVHTTHISAAQHAAAEVLRDPSSPRWKIYPCPRNPGVLHVGR